MKTLLATTAIIEFGAGVALAFAPSLVASILLGTSLDTPVGISVGRITGAALVTLGIACWLARRDGQTPATRGLVTAMLFYNIAVALVLATAAINSGLFGIALWPGVGLHTVMGVWCVVCLRQPRANERSNSTAL